MPDQTCDFCGAAVQWDASQIQLNMVLRLRGLGGLGACCPACDEKQVALSLREMAEEYARMEEEDHG